VLSPVGCARYLGDVRRLHLHLLNHELESDELESLSSALAGAGHLLTNSDGDGPVEPKEQAPDLLIHAPGVIEPPETLEAAEARHIALALEHTGGNRRQAAFLLGIARSTLLAKIRKYAL
jgi:DNA-binding NtrC family response regulator